MRRRGPTSALFARQRRPRRTDFEIEAGSFLFGFDAGDQYCGPLAEVLIVGRSPVVPLLQAVG
jgi:hypothetical protein